MFISDLPNSKNLHSAVIQELRSHGVKYRLKKPSSKNIQSNGALFGAPLQNVPQQTVMCCGTTLHVPVLVHEACCFLKASVHFEGLFRKAGSQNRQREIKRLLETGCKIDKSYHAVDIAGILKLYLRSLPEPLLGPDMQEVLLRCLLLADHLKLTAVQNALLLLPLPYLDLLHYIMEFFRYVSSKSEVNKMDSNNLAIVLSPSIMPLPSSCPQQRMEQHLKLIKMLIENAGIIGTIPVGLSKHLEEDLEKEEEKIKKKRRSGSLTRMLNGLRKIVTGTNNHQQKSMTPDILATPVLDKCGLKRKQDSHLGLSAKKRLEILSKLPQQSMCTPIRSLGEKEYKRLRLSIGRKPKSKPTEYKTALKEISPYVPNDVVLNTCSDDKNSNYLNELIPDLTKRSKQNDFVTISKSEYEEIKQRVSAIESKISHEFNVMNVLDHNNHPEPVQQVQCAYEKTCEEVANLASPTTEHLAKRLSRELKIRRSNEHKIMRSPSARKIGTIRRRSRENVTKLKRTQTWNVPSTYTGPVANGHEYISSHVSLKRGKPNTLNTGLMQPTIISVPMLESETRSDSVLKRRVSVADASDNNHVTNISIRANVTRSQVKRTSYHGETDNRISQRGGGEIKSTSINEISWKNAKSFLSNVENIENQQTGRASVAELRSQNAGMVLAKARLFDGMTDSDTSIEKKVVSKPIRQNGFARKPRKNISDLQSKSTLNSSEETDKSMGDVRNSKKPVKSPNNALKRPNPRSLQSPSHVSITKDNLNLSTQLKNVIYDVCTPMSDKINTASRERTPGKMNSKVSAGCRTPRVATPGKKPVSVKLNKSLVHVRGVNRPTNSSSDGKRPNGTPLRAVHLTPRKSPRLMNVKSRYNN